MKIIKIRHSHNEEIAKAQAKEKNYSVGASSS
jgi:hypothetical protein